MANYNRNSEKNFLNRTIGRLSVTTWIILVNVLVYFIILIFTSYSGDSLKYFALTPSYLFQGKYIWTLLLHMFSHLYFWHIFANMFTLFFIGRVVERLIGRKRYVWFYLVSGLFAGILTSGLSILFGYGFYARIFGDSSIPMLGASGAIFGLVGLLAVLIPYSRIYLILGPLIAVVIQAIIDVVIKSTGIVNILTILLNVYIFVSIFSLLTFNSRTRMISLPVQMPLWLLPIIAIVPLFIIGLFITLPIANIAHFGGLFVGLVYGYYLKQKYPQKIIILRRMFR